MNRYPLQTVLDMEKCSIAELARRTGISRRTLHRWLRDGVTFYGADRLATALGTSAWLLWPAWDEESLERAEEATPERLVKREKWRDYYRRTAEQRRAYYRQYRRHRRGSPMRESR